eukprot:6318888-Pyramimonas_sp.AAC.2
MTGRAHMTPARPRRSSVCFTSCPPYRFYSRLMQGLAFKVNPSPQLFVGDWGDGSGRMTVTQQAARAGAHTYKDFVVCVLNIMREITLT